MPRGTRDLHEIFELVRLALLQVARGEGLHHVPHVLRQLLHQVAQLSALHDERPGRLRLVRAGLTRHLDVRAMLLTACLRHGCRARVLFFAEKVTTRTGPTGAAADEFDVGLRARRPSCRPSQSDFRSRTITRFRTAAVVRSCATCKQS